MRRFEDFLADIKVKRSGLIYRRKVISMKQYSLNEVDVLLKIARF